MATIARSGNQIVSFADTRSLPRWDSKFPERRISNWRILERLSSICAAGNCRRPNRVSAREFHRASPHRRTTDARAAFERLLEDVLHRHSVGRDSGPADLFSASYSGLHWLHTGGYSILACTVQGTLVPVPGNFPFAARSIHTYRVRHHRRPVVPADESDRQEPGKPL